MEEVVIGDFASGASPQPLALITQNGKNTNGTGLVSTLKKQRFIARILHDDGTDFARTKRDRLDLFIRIAIPTLAFFSLSDLILGSYWSAGVIFTSLIFQVTAALKLRRGDKRESCARWFFASVVLVFATSHLWDGQAKSMSLWLVPVLPMCGAFLEGMRSALRCLFVATVIILFAMVTSTLIDTTQWIENTPDQSLALRFAGMIFFAVSGLLSRSVTHNQKHLLAEQELEVSRIKSEHDAAVKSKATFFANVSHEIRTPMNGILGMTEMLLASPLHSRVRESVGLMHNCAKDLLNLLNQILDLSALEMANRDRSARSVDLAKVIEKKVKGHRSSGRYPRLTFQLKHPSFITELRADTELLDKILDLTLNFAIQEAKSGVLELEFRERSEPSGEQGIELLLTYPTSRRSISAESSYESQAHHLDSLRTASVSVSIIAQFAHMMKGTLTVHNDASGSSEQLLLFLPLNIVPEEALHSLNQAATLKVPFGLRLATRVSDWFKESKRSEESKMLSIMQLLVLPGVTGFFIDSIRQDQERTVIIYSVSLSLLLFSAIVNFCSTRTRFASWTSVVAAMLLAGTLNVSDGQIWSESLWALPGVPVAALFLLGYRAFAGTLLVCVGLLIGVYWMSIHVPLVPEHEEFFFYLLAIRMLLLQIFGGLSVLAAYVSRNFSIRYKRKRRDMLLALKASEKAHSEKSKFLTNMSHEIRTPMNGILGLAESLLHGELAQDQHHAIQTIHRCGGHLLALLGDVFDLSQLQGGQDNVSRVEMNLDEVLRDVLYLFRSKANMKGIELVCVGNDSSLRVMGDPTRLMQILSNLVGNAIKFSDRGRVELALVSVEPKRRHSQNGYDVIIEVRDQGIGIAESRIEDLFCSYVQIEQSSGPSRGGTGLGLAISRRLVRAMGGELEVQSSAGSGSIFRISLWLGAADRFPSDLHVSTSVDVTSATVRSTASVESGQRSVLVVDDNPINLKVAVASLKRLGYHADTAINGEQAVSICQDTRYDAILMDVRMPGIDGMEATRLIRASQGACKHIPILALTADNYEEQKQLCFEAGMDAHLAKPYRAQELNESLQKLWRSTNATKRCA